MALCCRRTEDIASGSESMALVLESDWVASGQLFLHLCYSPRPIGLAINRLKGAAGLSLWREQRVCQSLGSHRQVRAMA